MTIILEIAIKFIGILFNNCFNYKNMQEAVLDLLCCPISRLSFSINIIKRGSKILDGVDVNIIEEAILFTTGPCFYPIIKGVPRLNVEAVFENEDFLKLHLTDFEKRKEKLLEQYGEIIAKVIKKNKRTKESFGQEWKLYDNEADKTWDANSDEMLERFLKETNEDFNSLKSKLIFDAGCGNGKLNSLLAQKGILNVAMDFSNSIEKAFVSNKYKNVHFIQGDVQFPPVIFNHFDIVHCSGVLIHTNNTEYSFSCIDPIVKKGGKLSVWLYHPRKEFIHNLFNSIRKRTSKLPTKIQYYFYRATIFPISFIVKRIKGNKQNSREMMIDILDWFSPEFRWEHEHDEVKGWFNKRNYSKIEITTEGVFGFNIIGEKTEYAPPSPFI